MFTNSLGLLVLQVQHLLPTIRSQLEGINSLLSEQVGAQEPHLVPLVITYLRKLDIDLLQQLYNELEKNSDITSMYVVLNLNPISFYLYFSYRLTCWILDLSIFVEEVGFPEWEYVHSSIINTKY